MQHAPLCLLLFGGVLAAQTTINVTTLADNLASPPAGSLRAAILAANLARGGIANPITIAFAAPLVGQTITLAAQLPFLNASNVTFSVPVANNTQRVTIDANTQLGAFIVTGNDVTFRYLRIRGGLLDTLSLYGCARATFEFCDVQNTGEGACYSVGARNTTYRDCTFEGGTGLGILAVDGGDGLRLERCIVRNYANNAGLTCTGIAGLVVTGCTFSGSNNGIQILEACRDAVIGPSNTLTGNKVSGLSATLALRMQIVSSTIRSNGGWGVYLQDRCVDTLVDNCVFDQNGTGSSSIGPGSSQLVLSHLDRVTIKRTNFTAGYGNGVELIASSNVTFDPTAPVCLISGNRGNALKTQTQCSVVRLDQVDMQGNCTVLSEPQVILSDSSAVVLNGCKITASTKGGLQTVRCSNVTVTGGTRIQNNGQDAVSIGDSSDVVIGPRNPADPVELGCLITGNGGGLYFDKAVDCRLNGNTVLSGGGCAVTGNGQPITITNSSLRVVIGPQVTVTPTSGTSIVVTGGSNLTQVRGCTLVGYTGNAAFVTNATNTEIRSCTMTGSAASGTGVLVDRSNGTSLFSNVVSGHNGQGIVIQDSANVLVGPGNIVKRNTREGVLIQQAGAALPTSVTMESSQITNNGLAAGNYGGVFARSSTLKMVNCTVASSFTLGHYWNLYIDSSATATVANSLFWGARYCDRFLAGGISRMDYSIYGTQTGSTAWSAYTGNNTTTDPQLVNVASDDVHVVATSPAKNSGTNAPTNVALPSADYEGDARVLCTTVDKGADELTPCFLGNALDLVGPWTREPGQSRLQLGLDASNQSGRTVLLLASFAGATNGVPLANGAVLPLQPDAVTFAFLDAPAFSLVQLDGQGRGTFTLELPPPLLDAFGRQVAFAFTVVPTLDFVSNPVVVRFFQ